MKLSDLVIEHGPWTEHDAAALLTLRAVQGRAAAELNELREELLAARAVLEAHRFPIDGVWHTDDTAGLDIRCIRCPWVWSDQDGETDLAELNRRAAEHAEVCG